MKKILFPLFLTAQTLFADEAAPTTGGGGGTYIQTLIMLAIAVVFFYFILWRPEKKRRKRAEEMRSALKKGDRVTAMGIIGTVNRVMDKTVILKMYDGTKIEVLKAAISDIQPGTSSEESENPSESTIKES